MYMAPEQFSGAHLDEKMDVYALGCILNECYTRRQPWQNTPNFFQVSFSMYGMPCNNLLSDMLEKALDLFVTLKPESCGADHSPSSDQGEQARNGSQLSRSYQAADRQMLGSGLTKPPLVRRSTEID